MKKHWHKVELWVDLLIPVCIILLLVIIILEIFFRDIAQIYHTFIVLGDYFIIFIFSVDLIFKYIRMRNVPLFLRRYWLDILAVFPFYLFFRLVEFVLAALPLSDSLRAVQLILHEGLEVEKEGSKIIKEAGQTSRIRRLARLIRPTLRLPRFLKIISFYETPTGRHHHYER